MVQFVIYVRNIRRWMNVYAMAHLRFSRECAGDFFCQCVFIRLCKDTELLTILIIVIIMCSNFEPQAQCTIASDLLLMIICFIEVIKWNPVLLKLCHLLLHICVFTVVKVLMRMAYRIWLDSINVDHKAEDRRCTFADNCSRIICKWLISQTIS